MFTPKLKYFYIVAIASLTSSCATILTSSNQRVTIDSNPPGAEILINGKNCGITPSKVRVKRELKALSEGEKDVTLKLDGYESNPYAINASLNPVAIINLASIIGWAVDAATGAITKYDNYSKFELVKTDGNKKENKELANNKKVSQPTTDKYSELKKLKGLLDDGIITQEEFNKEKAKLLK